jgi:hypothetical protein
LELAIINLITQPDESPDQQAASDGCLRGGITATHQQPAIDQAQFLIMPRRHVACFHQ